MMICVQRGRAVEWWRPLSGCAVFVLGNSIVLGVGTPGSADLRRWMRYPKEHRSPLRNPLGLPEPRPPMVLSELDGLHLSPLKSA